MAGHGHEHGHELKSWRDFVTTAVLVALAVFDLLVGLALMNPAILAEAWHNFFDATYTLTTGVLKLMTRNSQSHSRRYHWPAAVGIGLCFVTIVATTGLTIAEMFEQPDTSVGAAVTVGLLGLLGFAVNFLLARFIQRGGSGYDHGNQAHLMSDAMGSLILAGTGLLAAGTAWNWPDEDWLPWAIYGAGSAGIIVWVAHHNLSTSRMLARQLRDCLRDDRAGNN